MNVTWQYAVFCANATRTSLNEVGLNPRFKFKTPYVDIEMPFTSFVLNSSEKLF